MSKKSKIISVYLAIGVVFALYGWLFGDNSYKSFAYNLGMGLVWPVMIFPALGQVMGVVILVAFIALLTVL